MTEKYIAPECLVIPVNPSGIILASADGDIDDIPWGEDAYESLCL